jgi:hypothetical protein
MTKTVSRFDLLLACFVLDLSGLVTSGHLYEYRYRSGGNIYRNVGLQFG